MNEKENTFRALKRENPEWVPCMHKTIAMVNPSSLHDREDNGKDWFGVTWEESVPDNITPMFTDITKWREYITFPDLDKIDWAGCAKKDLEDIDRDEKIVWLLVRVGLFERIHAFMGFEATLMAFYDAPEALHDLVDTYTAYRLQVIEKLIEHYDPDVVAVHDDYGTQRALFMNPDLWREYFKENLRKIVSLVHSHGKLYTMHSCGKVDVLIEDFIEIGVDIWDSVQPCCDLEMIVDKYGDKLSFSPGLDTQRISLGTPEDARQNVRETLDILGRYGGVIPHDSQPTVTPEIREAIRDEIETYGKRIYAER